MPVKHCRKYQRPAASSAPCCHGDASGKGGSNGSHIQINPMLYETACECEPEWFVSSWKEVQIGHSCLWNKKIKKIKIKKLCIWKHFSHCQRWIRFYRPIHGSWWNKAVLRLLKTWSRNNTFSLKGVFWVCHVLKWLSEMIILILLIELVALSLRVLAKIKSCKVFCNFQLYIFSCCCVLSYHEKGTENRLLSCLLSCKIRQNTPKKSFGEFFMFF